MEKIPLEVLDKIIETTERAFENYERKPDLSKEQVIDLVHTLYDKKKEIKWLDDVIEVRNKIENSKKPWAYHYSLNLNWVLFFTIYWTFLQKYWTQEERDEMWPTIEKVEYLKMIFDNVDGIIEDDNIVYIIKDDFEFIKPKLERWKV